MPYDGTNIKDLDATKPTEGSSYIPELNDSDREIKTVIKNQYAITSKSTDYTLTDSDSIIIATAPITITLPSASLYAGSGYTKQYIIKSIPTNMGNVSISGSIDGGTITLEPGDVISIFSDGTSWYKENLYDYDLVETIEDYIAEQIEPALPVYVQVDGSSKGGQQTLNFIADGDITIDAVEDTENEKIDITISCPEVLTANDILTITSQPSTTIMNSNDNQVSVLNTSYGLKKQTLIGQNTGPMRIYITGRALTTDQAIYISVRHNSTELDEFIIEESEGEQTKYVDLENGLSSGDYINIYAYVTGGMGNVKNLRFAYDGYITHIVGQELNTPLKLKTFSAYTMTHIS